MIISIALGGTQGREGWPLWGEEEAHIREHWSLSGSQTRVGGVYETTEGPPSPEPRFNLLIFLINHSPSSYPL